MGPSWSKNRSRPRTQKRTAPLRFLNLHLVFSWPGTIILFYFCIADEIRECGPRLIGRELDMPRHGSRILQHDGPPRLLVLSGQRSAAMCIRSYIILMHIIKSMTLMYKHAYIFSLPGLTRVAFAVGVAGFLLLLFPLTSPDLYSDSPDDCRCWHGRCCWD